MSDLFLDHIVQPERPREPGSGRRTERAERERQRRRRRRRWVAVLITLVVLAGAVVVVNQVGMPILDSLFGGQDDAPEDYPGPGHTPVDVVIEPGATGAQMAGALFDAGVVASTGAFTLAFAANPDAASIQPGTYRLLLQMKASEAVVALLNIENRIQTQVTIPEGFQMSQILERLHAVTAIPVEDFEAALADPAAVGLPAEAGENYEGWLFPDTYSFEPDTTATQMISMMIAQMISVLDERGVAPADRLRVLTIASLVEREARLDTDRPIMARAILNRLDQEMRLQIDATVAYGLGVPGTELTQENLDTDGPYNTYTRAGLPPTPIASPGTASIDAVLAPADGAWLFWVTVNLDSGETRFAETYDEHLENRELLRQWQAENETP